MASVVRVGWANGSPDAATNTNQATHSSVDRALAGHFVKDRRYF